METKVFHDGKTFQHKVAGSLESIPGESGHEAGYTLGRVPTHTHTHSHTTNVRNRTFNPPNCETNLLTSLHFFMREKIKKHRILLDVPKQVTINR